MSRPRRAKIVIVSTKTGLHADFVGKGFLDTSEKKLLVSFGSSHEARIVERIPVDESGQDDNAELFRALNLFLSTVGANTITDTLEDLILRIYKAGLTARQ